MMTVKEMIDKLQTMPPHAIVIYRACSDWQELDPKDIELITADTSREKTEKATAKRILEGQYNAPGLRGCWIVPSSVNGAICCRKGAFTDAYTHDIYPPGESPVYVDVVTLPGN